MIHENTEQSLAFLSAEGEKLGMYSASVLIESLCSYSAAMREVAFFWLPPNWLELVTVLHQCETTNLFVVKRGKENIATV